MNCQEFSDRLYDYVDGTLRGDALASVREHLHYCGDCRRALLREQAIAQSISHALDRVTSSLSIHPEMLRNVLEAAEFEPIRPNILYRAWQWFILNPIRPVGAGATILAAILLFFGLPTRQQPASVSGSKVVTQTHQNSWVIDVPIPTQIHVFRRQNGTVVDAFIPIVAFGHARFTQPENSTKSL